MTKHWVIMLRAGEYAVARRYTDEEMAALPPDPFSPNPTGSEWMLRTVIVTDEKGLPFATNHYWKAEWAAELLSMPDFISGDGK